jgi:dTDP-N-acetylfucosamine:lipid II N-acetylfucosaminyltransferase
MPVARISILHIASDEKFINAANYIFEKAFPGCNHFIIPRSRFNRTLNYVTLEKNVEIVINGSRLTQKISSIISKYNCVFLHGITEENSALFLSSQQKEKFIGILWGAELYSEENFPKKSLMGDITVSIKLPEAKSSVKDKMKDLIRRIIYPNPMNLKGATKAAALGLSYFSVLYNEEFDFFKDRKIISEPCKMIPFTYYPLEYMIKGNETLTVEGNDILIGNSASYTNNHLEAFHILKKTGTGDRNLIVPLSYGDMIYADYIHTQGSYLFNSHFKSLRKFMPLAKYIKELHHCGIVIMNHYRQQAFGNVLLMLWLGSKVYLNESNTIFHYLKRIGIIVFSIEKDMTGNNPLALNNLTRDEMEHNRSILKNEICEKRIIKSLQEEIFKYF